MAGKDYPAADGQGKTGVPGPGSARLYQNRTGQRNNSSCCIPVIKRFYQHGVNRDQQCRKQWWRNAAEAHQQNKPAG